MCKCCCCYCTLIKSVKFLASENRCKYTHLRKVKYITYSHVVFQITVLEIDSIINTNLLSASLENVCCDELWNELEAEEEVGDDDDEDEVLCVVSETLLFVCSLDEFILDFSSKSL